METTEAGSAEAAANTQQKKLAIDVHSDQSALFTERYNVIAEDPYRNCFVYSRKRLNEWLDRLMPHNGAGVKLLDVGCGTGYHLRRFRDRGFEISGVDGSADMLTQARQANPGIEFKQADVDQLPYPDRSFDMILCVEVYRYLPDIAPCTREIARVLKPGGIALVTVAPPLPANAYPLVNRLSAAMKISDLTRLKQFFQSAGHLRSTFRAAGFAGTEVHGVYGGPMVWIERLAPKAMPPLLRAWEAIDAATADAPVLKHFSNMFLVRATR
jgi:ubiquinone/menaquinone biosynthesis C-methylase UbiE